jgi:hypothetical protein
MQEIDWFESDELRALKREPVAKQGLAGVHAPRVIETSESSVKPAKEEGVIKIDATAIATLERRAKARMEISFAKKDASFLSATRRRAPSEVASSEGVTRPRATATHTGASRD